MKDRLQVEVETKENLMKRKSMLKSKQKSDRDLSMFQILLNSSKDFQKVLKSFWKNTLNFLQEKANLFKKKALNC